MLAYESTGNGLPLVFIHAYPLSRRMWDENKPFFAKHFRFITVDLPGFGASPAAAETSSMESMANGVIEVIDHLKISEKFVVAGLSMGGYAMLQLLKKAPLRVRAAAFLSTRSAADSDDARKKRHENVEFIQKNGMGPAADRLVTTLLGKTTQTSNPKLVEQVKSWIRSAEPKGVCAALRGMAERPDTTSIVESLSVPTFFLAGSEDVVIPAADMEALSKSAKKPRFQIIPEAGHLINLEKPDLFNEAFSNFLKSRVL